MTTEQTFGAILIIGTLILGGAITRSLVLDGVSAGMGASSPTINNTQVNN